MVNPDPSDLLRDTYENVTPDFLAARHQPSAQERVAIVVEAASSHGSESSEDSDP